MDSSTHQKPFKGIFVGDSKSGKTSIIHRLVEGYELMDVSATIGGSFKKFQVDIEGKTVAMNLWDTAGQERFLSVTRPYFRNSSFAVLVYAIDDLISFESIEKWRKEVISTAPPYVKLILLGNKSDLIEERAVNYVIAQKYARENNFELFAEVSAKTGDGIEAAFYQIAGMHLQNSESAQIQRVEKKSGCC